MRIVITLLAALSIVWVIVHRDRLYVHDPFASVYRNDVKQSGVEVDFNFSNDILFQPNGDLSGPRTILQHWDLMPGTPASLACLRWIVCLTSADHAPVLAPDLAVNPKYDPHANMNGRHISFIDTSGARIRVDL